MQLLGKVVDTSVVYNNRVMVQTVQFLDQVQLLGKVVDTPVVCNDRGHSPDRAVPGQGCCHARCFYDRCTWFQTCVNVWDVPVTMQRLCGVYDDRAVEGFSPYFYGFFRPPLRT